MLRHALFGVVLSDVTPSESVSGRGKGDAGKEANSCERARLLAVAQGGGAGRHFAPTRRRFCCPFWYAGWWGPVGVLEQSNKVNHIFVEKEP